MTLALLLTLAVSAAQAQPDEASWEVGVAPARREAALELFRRGNELFTESEYASAAEAYRRALDVWDHPRIHGNLATALIHLDEPLDAIEQVERALEYGPAPFEPHVHAQLLTNHKLLEAQLATVEVSSDVEGAAFTLDGQPLFVAPGRHTVRVRAGRHQLVARKPNYLTETRSLSALGGETLSLAVNPLPLDDVTTYERRWAAWKPWTLLGAGISVSVVGVALGRASLAARDDYELGLGLACPRGCLPQDIPPSVVDQHDRAQRLNRAEVSAYALGGAAVLAGAVLAYLNRERRIYARPAADVAVLPAVGIGLVGAALQWRR